MNLFAAVSCRIFADDRVHSRDCCSGAVCRDVLKEIHASFNTRAWVCTLPLITTNCAVLGVALNSVTKGYNILESVVYGLLPQPLVSLLLLCLWLVYVRRLSIMIFQSLSREQPSCFLQRVLWLSHLWDSQEWFLYRIGGKVI